MTCDGRGKVPCAACDGTGSYSAPFMPSLGLYTVSICPTCMGKKWTARCVGCDACSAKDAGEAKKQDTQGSLFKP